MYTDEIINEIINELNVDHNEDTYESATRIWNRLKELNVVKNFSERLKDNNNG